MFQVVLLGKKAGEFGTFNDAFRFFFKEIQVQLCNEGVSRYEFDTTNFLTYVDPGNKNWFMNFHQARVFAYSIGLVIAGEIQNGINEPSEPVLQKAFTDAASENITLGFARFVELAPTLIEALR